MADDSENPYRKAPKGETAAAKKTRQGKFYHQQRIDAEETGDQGTVNKIYGKLGKKSLVGARKGDTSLNVDSNTSDKAALGTVAALAGGGGALRAGARFAGGAAKEAAGAVGSALAKRGGSAVAKAAGNATRTAAKSGSTRKLPGAASRLSGGESKALSGGKQIPDGSALAKPAMRNVTGTARKALTGGRSDAVPVGKGSSSARPAGRAQKALPKPKGPAPKMQHTRVKAGSKRSQQDTPRNKGTNPKAKKASS